MQWLPCGYGHKKLVGGAHTVEGRLFTATYLFTYKHVNHVLTIQTGERPPGHQSFPPPRPSPALSTPRGTSEERPRISDARAPAAPQRASADAAGRMRCGFASSVRSPSVSGCQARRGAGETRRVAGEVSARAWGRAWGRACEWHWASPANVVGGDVRVRGGHT